MKILITWRGNGHLTYRKMAEKPRDAMIEMGHDVITDFPKDIGQDLTIILGYSANWEQVKDLPGKKIWWCHGANWSTHSNYKKDNEQVWDLIRNCDAVAYQSEFAKHMAQKYLELNREGPIIFNAAKKDFYETYPKATSINEVHIGTAAVWREWKRLKEMEEIIDKANKETEWLKHHLWVYGRDREEKTYGNPEYIHYLGMSEDFPKYKDCHYYMQLSFNDFSPATVGEAMAKGLPVICSNSGGSKDIVKGAGIVVDIDPYIDYSINTYKQIPEIDYNKVTEAMRTMLHNIEMFRNKTKDKVISEINSEHSAKHLLNLYETIK